MKIKALILSGLIFALTGCDDSDSSSKGGSSVWVKVPSPGLSCNAARTQLNFDAMAETACSVVKLRYTHESRCVSNQAVAEALCSDF